MAENLSISSHLRQRGLRNLNPPLATITNLNAHNRSNPLEELKKVTIAAFGTLTGMLIATTCISILENNTSQFIVSSLHSLICVIIMRKILIYKPNYRKIGIISTIATLLIFPRILLIKKYILNL